MSAVGGGGFVRKEAWKYVFDRKKRNALGLLSLHIPAVFLMQSRLRV